MFDLIRFFEKKEYVEDFLNGNLYMNSIGHFWKLNPTPQKDVAEGLFETISPERFDSKYQSNLSTVIGRENILMPFMNRIEANKYCHVCCLSLHEYDNVQKLVLKIPDQMRSMGKFAVRIHNVQKFVDRIFDKLQKQKLYGLMGPITYHGPNEESEYRDLFDKINNHAYEHEWRFALIPDYERAKKLAAENVDREYDEYIYFRIGDLRSIAAEVPVNALLNDIGSLYESGGIKFTSVDEMPVPWSKRKTEVEKALSKKIPIPYDAYPEQYVGFAPRKAFKNKIMEIDNGAFRPLFVLG